MKLDPEVFFLSPYLYVQFLFLTLFITLFDLHICQVNLVNSEAVFLVGKATEQFVECLALEVGHIFILASDYF